MNQILIVLMSYLTFSWTGTGEKFVTGREDPIERLELLKVKMKNEVFLTFIESNR